jgi:hypothetical protein
MLLDSSILENAGQNSIGINNFCGKYFHTKIIALQINLYNNAKTTEVHAGAVALTFNHAREYRSTHR